MTFLVFCTFDLKNASPQDYANAYGDLERLGLKRVHVANNKNSVVIPTTSAMGEVLGTGAAAVRDLFAEQVKHAFSSRGFKSEIFVTVGGDWAWGARST